MFIYTTNRLIVLTLFFILLALFNKPVKSIETSDYSIRHDKFKIEKWHIISSREKLARRIEKIFTISPETLKISEAKVKIENEIEASFLRMLKSLKSAEHLWLKSHPFTLKSEINQLKSQVLMGELSFKPVVDRLPEIVRIINANEFFIEILKILQKSENETSRQFGNIKNLGKIIDALGKFSVKDVTTFVKEIQELMETIETVFEGVDIGIDD